jgi:hypothetical protein
MASVRGTQGMTTSVTEAFKKIGTVCRQRWLGAEAKTFNNHQSLCFGAMPCAIFLIAGVKLLAWLV